jgi:hypothetical protein
MERTADRCALHFQDDFDIFTASDARSRPPSLILVSLDLMREVVLLVVAVVVTSCAPYVPVNLRSDPPSREPAISGNERLIPTSELHALLAVARHRLAVIAPDCPIGEVAIKSATEVTVVYCYDDFAPNGWMRGRMDLRRVSGQWKVTSEQRPTKPDAERVII